MLKDTGKVFMNNDFSTSAIYELVNIVDNRSVLLYNVLVN